MKSGRPYIQPACFSNQYLQFDPNVKVYDENESLRGCFGITEAKSQRSIFRNLVTLIIHPKSFKHYRNAMSETFQNGILNAEEIWKIAKSSKTIKKENIQVA